MQPAVRSSGAHFRIKAREAEGAPVTEPPAARSRKNLDWDSDLGSNPRGPLSTLCDLGHVTEPLSAADPRRKRGSFTLTRQGDRKDPERK